MTKRIYTGIKDRNGVKVFTGDIVTMHYFGLGIGELGGAVEIECEAFGKVRVHWYKKNKERRFCVEDLDGVRYPFSLMQEPSEEIEVYYKKKTKIRN